MPPWTLAPVTRSIASAASEDPLWEMVSAEMASETWAARARNRSSPTSLLASMISSASTNTSASSAPMDSETLIVVVSPAATATSATVCAP